MSQIQTSHQQSSSQTSAARLALLDFLRGFSLLGILAVNLPYFAEPPYGFSPFHSTNSEVTRFLLNFFFTGKSTATRSVKLMLHLSIPNCVFTVLAITLLSDQDWYSCRKWTDTDVSNVSRKSHDPARFVTGLTFFS